MVFSILNSILYAVLIFQLCNSQQCMTKQAGPCIFPFEYQNKTYTGCKPDEVKPERSWCSTQVDREGRHMEGGGVTWGFCSTDCPLEGDQECEETRQCVSSKECPEFREFKKMSKTHPDYQTEINKWRTRICNRKEKRLCCSKPKPVCDGGQEYPGNYLPSLGHCGKECSSDRIVGGGNAGLGEFPWAALLGYTITTRRQEYPSQKWVTVKATRFRCGGTLINTRYVLTAAHCQTGGTNISSVVLGEWQVGKDPDCPEGSRDRSSCKPRRQKIEVESVTIHEGYSKDKITGEVVNDIALIRLKKPAVLNEAVQLICLPFNEEDTTEEMGIENLEEGIVGRSSTVIGWGGTENFASNNTDCQGVPHCILQKVDVPIISNEDCQAELNKLNQESTIRSSHICAVKENACKGDGGGGMFISKNLDDKTDDTYVQVIPTYVQVGIKENLQD